MKSRTTPELIAVLAALAAGILWTIAAVYGLTEMLAPDASTNVTMPEMMAKLAKLRAASWFNAAAAVASAISAFAQTMVLFQRKAS